MNVDLKIIPKSLSEKLKEVLPDLISSQQTTYRHIGESRRLISDVIKITEIKNTKYTTEKAFDLLDHNFLISTLGKYGFGQNFILWVQILLKDQESRVIGKTTKYFLLRRGARQFDPISTFLFILALEILFLLTKTKPEITELTVFDHCYLYSACADDTTFSLKDTISMKNMVDTFHFFFRLLRIKTKLVKIGEYRYWSSERVQVTICGMYCVNVKNDTVKTLGTHFSYNVKLKGENIYTTVTDIQQVLKMWKMRNLILEEKTVVFKTLAISKIVFQSLITSVPRHIVNELENLQKAFLWKNSSPEIKHEILCNDYKDGGLKSLQWSWIRRLYGNSFHEWKLVTLFLIKKSFGSSFKFHSNLFF